MKTKLLGLLFLIGCSGAKEPEVATQKVYESDFYICRDTLDLGADHELDASWQITIFQHSGEISTITTCVAFERINGGPWNVVIGSGNCTGTLDDGSSIEIAIFEDKKRSGIILNGTKIVEGRLGDTCIKQ